MQRTLEDVLDRDNLAGLIINHRRAKYYFFKSRHWFAVRKLAPDMYANVNSSISKPRALSRAELLQFLQTSLEQSETNDGDEFTIIAVTRDDGVN